MLLGVACLPQSERNQKLQAKPTDFHRLCKARFVFEERKGVLGQPIFRVCLKIAYKRDSVLFKIREFMTQPVPLTPADFVIYKLPPSTMAACIANDSVGACILFLDSLTPPNLLVRPLMQTGRNSHIDDNESVVLSEQTFAAYLEAQTRALW